MEDRIGSVFFPLGKCLAELFVVGVFGGNHQTLPLGQLVSELAVLRSQVADPLGCLLKVIFRGLGWAVVLDIGRGFGLEGAERGPGLAGVAAA